MSPEKSKKLMENYPELFAHSDNLRSSLMSFGFSCSDGWYHLIDTACSALVYEYRVAKKEYERSLEVEKDPSSIPAYQLNNYGSVEAYLLAMKANYQLHQENCPYLTQVKEKFGTLRIYVSRATAEAHAVIEAMESLSAVTCEECGAPGLRAGRGWVRTLCAHHMEEAHGKEYVEEVAQAYAASEILDELFKGASFLEDDF